MFDPMKPDAISTLQDKDLSSLPNAEDDLHEYKSSATKDSELAEKIARAASAFWNSGGGLFVAGVNDKGQTDGGVSLLVGRQSRRDWIDQAIARVTPRARYVVHTVEDQGASLNIAAGNGIILIGFAESEAGPHMAPDNKYYIRAGAHSVPATHFIVEAIYARRGLRTPTLTHVVRRKSGDAGVVQVGIVALTEVPAINVSVTISPMPQVLQPYWTKRFPLQVPVISSSFPCFLDIDYFPREDEQIPEVDLCLEYSDLANRSYMQTLRVSIDRQLGPNLGGGNQFKSLERAIDKVADAVKGKR